MDLSDKIQTICFCIGIAVMPVLAFAMFFRSEIYRDRLESVRLELEQTRAELDRASDRQRDIEAMVNRGTEVLSSSIDTIADIKVILGQIKENYTTMESILAGNGRYSYIYNSNTPPKEINND